MNKNLSYPENLLSDIEVDCNNYSVGHLDDILNYLEPREKEIVYLRYKKKCTYAEIGKKFDLTQERIGQIVIKSILKLKNNFRNKLIKEKVIEDLEKRNEILERKLDFFRSTTYSNYRNEEISVLGLSARAINSLRKNHIFTVGQLLSVSEESLNRIRNIGKKTAEEIIQRVHDEGLEFID